MSLKIKNVLFENGLQIFFIVILLAIMKNRKQACVET
jgi:hypothetical protein